uniref:Uncharacterized protein n=1 Tax=Rhizophora mucronata TaxID=61149 RepID=A0A2P2PWV7_RHIMU
MCLDRRLKSCVCNVIDSEISREINPKNVN